MTSPICIEGETGSVSHPYEPEECSIPIFDSDRNEPECIVCPVWDVCETDNAPVTITKDIRKEVWVRRRRI